MRTPLSIAAVLTAVTACGLVGLSAAPAAAKCTDQVQQGAPISDTPWPQQLWNLKALPGDATGKGIKVAVLDSGVDPKHPQLRDKIVGNLDLLHGVAGPEDCVGHGTAVAGLIAGTRMNGTPFQGLAPEAQILSARVSENVPGNDDGKQAKQEQIASAVRWAVAQGAKVINISFAYDSEAGLDDLKQAIAYAVDQGVVVVAAVGNKHEEGNPTPYPAAWPGVVGVAAIGFDGYQRLSASQVGTYVDIAAPGVDVVAPRPGKGYAAVSGTSFAAPLVAATAALIFDRFSDEGITAAQVIERLFATADPAPGGRNSDGYGVGVVNPLRAVTDVVDGRAPVKAEPLPVPQTDIAALNAEKRAREREEQAWWFAGIGTLVGIVVLTLAISLPAGTRRRWRPAGR